MTAIILIFNILIGLWKFVRIKVQESMFVNCKVYMELRGQGSASPASGFKFSGQHDCN